MGSVPGTNSCPFADVVTVVPSQAAACDTWIRLKVLPSFWKKFLKNKNIPRSNRFQLVTYVISEKTF